MKQNRNIVVGVLIFCLAVAASFFAFQSKTKIAHIDSQTQAIPSVSVTLDTGSSIATVSGVLAQNAYQALVGATNQQHLVLKTQHYDFGVFVEQIGALINSKDDDWIYLINGKSGTIAADKQAVHGGDMVEWKYTAPTF
jgi:hypothetical protein